MNHTAHPRLLRAVLVVLGLVSAAVAINVAFGGFATLGWQGPRRIVAVTDPDTYLVRDSHVRFYGGLYLGVAIFLVAASGDLVRHRNSLLLVFGLIFAGGLARLTQSEPGVTFGADLGVSTLIELVGMPLLAVWLVRATRAPGAALTTKVDVAIDRPADDVWSVVTDYATDTEWRKGISAMTPDRDGPPAVGTNVREVLQLAGREYVTDTTVTEVGPGMTYAFAGQGTSGVVRGRRTVEPGARAGSSVFRYDVELEPHQVPAVARPVLRWWLQRSLQRDVRRLQRMLEVAP